LEKEVSLIFSDSAISFMRKTIEEAKGTEVFFAGYFDETKQKITEVEAITFGNFDLTPVFLLKAYSCDAVIHNHPNGSLIPSDQDLYLAEKLMNMSGISSVIINNDVTVARIIFFLPFSEREVKKIKKEDILKYFKKDGPFSSIDDFEERESQIKMAEKVLDAFNENKKVIIEAPTGTGKSLSYLIPSIFWAIINREKVIISTYTKNLQHQLVDKDLFFLKNNLEQRFSYSIIKGRGNYLCKNKLDEAISDSLFEDKTIYEEIREWAKNSNGDLEELPFQIISQIYQEISSTPDTCLHKKCKYFKTCFYNMAKQKAFSSDIIISNHSLTILSLIDEREFFSLLPKTTRIVFDEAHNLKKAAYLSLEEVISSYSIKNKVNRLYYEGKKASGVLKKLLDITEEKEIVASLIENTRFFSQKLETFLFGVYSELSKKTEKEKDSLRVTSPIIEKEFFVEIEEDIKIFADNILKAVKEIRKKDRVEEKRPLLLKQLENTADYLVAVLSFLEVLYKGCPEDIVEWIDVDKSKNSFVIHRVPIDPFDEFSSVMKERINTAIFCSATLSIENDFSVFKESIKIKDVETLMLPSVFDYERQVKILIPSDINYSEDINEKQMEIIKKAIEITEGGTLVLCTSFSQVNKIKNYLRENTFFSILSQQEESKVAIIDKFKKNSSVLIGVDSFWEGIDIKGNTLRSLIIVKLPFSPPNTPLQQALYERAEKEGKNSFISISLPEAVIKLKQGFGRLIRGKEDRGTVLILDPRIIKKQYGKKFINSLPSTKNNTLIGNSELILKEIKMFHVKRICST